MKTIERKLWAMALAASIIGNALLFAAPARADIEDYHLYQQIWQQAYEFVLRRHVEETTEKSLLIGSIRGMLQATGDPYTRFLDRDEHREFRSAEDGRKVGIGVEVTIRDEVPLVIAPVEGGPAEKAGMLAGDRIVSIDGKATRKQSFGDILKMISGEIGTVVTLQVARAGLAKPITIQIKRGLFKLDYIKSGTLSGGSVGYIRLSQFFGSNGARTVDKFRQALIGFKGQKVRGIIVDLRNNPGGHLQMAVQLAAFFLKPGQLVVTSRGRTAEEERNFSAGSDAGLVPAETPVIVLINRGSASASEIFAGALQDHGRASLVGERTFGKASVQQIVRLPDDTAALVTVQKYYTPNKRSPHKVGLQPDEKVAALRPNKAESRALVAIRSSEFLKQFRKAHPSFTRPLVASFVAEAAGKGWKLREPVALLFLKRTYGVYEDVPDADTDPQLAAALRLVPR